MKSLLIKSFAALGLMLAMAPGGSVMAQSTDMSLTGSPSGGGVYPGFIYAAQLNASFFSGTSATLPANAIFVQFALPTGAEFDQTYPTIPAGWSYHTTDAQNVYVSNDVAVPAFTAVSFSVPFKVVAFIAAPAAGSYNTTGQITVINPNITDPTPSNNVINTTISVANQPLAIQLSSFDVNMQDCKANVKWSTATETNNAYFEVERSNDGDHFASIGRVKAAGFSTEKKDYSFVDESPLKGTDYYRLREVDVNGKSILSTVASARMNCDVDAIDIYPNPSTGIIYVKGLKDKATVEVYNVLGQKVISKTTQNTTEGVNLTGLADGSYQINVVNTASKIIFSTKVVKKA